MKLKSLLLFALAALLTLATPRPARAADVSFDFFYDSLSPYGEWIEVGDYGNCWRPSGVDEDWAPYSDGYWAYTDAGWTWVSYEEFGGIVYHYGRWAKVEDEGWVWVPDYEWGPAWVSWRRNDDYVGWAPLPAEAHFHRDRGISVWADTSYDIGPSNYNFCHTHDFGAPVLRPLIVRRTENIVIIGDTVNITNISYNERAGCAFNGGLDYGYVNRFARRPIPALKLVRNNNVTVVNNTIINNNVRVTNVNAVQRGNQLTVFSPNVARPQPAQLALVKTKTVRVVPQAKVNKGWNVVPQEQRDSLRAKFAQQTQGIAQDAPATPMKAADLKVVPVKADPKAKLPGPQPLPVAKTRGNPEQPNATAVNPAAPDAAVPPSAIAGKPGKKPGKGAAPVVAPQVPQNQPLTAADAPSIAPDAVPAAPVANGRPPKGKPGVTKPFNPAVADPQTPAATASEPNAAQTAADGRRAAAAAKQAAAQQKKDEVLRQRQEVLQQRMNNTPADAQPSAAQPSAAVPPPAAVQQPSPVRPRPNADDAARHSEAAAAAQQRKAEQQQDQQEAVARKQQAAQMQQQNQEVARERALQQSAARGAAAQQQQQQQAAAAAARREAAAERAPAQRPQQMPPQQARPAQQQQQQQVQQPRPAPQQSQQPAAPSKKPPQGGKRPLTPEEAAKLGQ